MEKVIYTTSSCEPHSYDQLKVFLHSLHKFDNTYPLILDLVNPTERQKTEVRILYPYILEVFGIAVHKLSGKRTMPVKEYTRPLYDVKVMYTRPLGLLGILTRKPEIQQVLSIDTDVIIRDNLSGIWAGVRPSSIKVWDKGPKKKDRVRYQAGVMVYGNSDVTRKYYTEVIRRIGDVRDLIAAQAALFWAYETFESEMTRIDMPEKYNDSFFLKKSKIWHCKNGHFNDVKYQKEYQYYLKKANGALHETSIP